MKKEKINRSPLFYVGDKYKLIKEIRQYFPSTINRFFEPFVGGGSVFLNVDANKYFLNDIDRHVIELHKFLCSYINRENDFFELISSIIKKYNLSFSFKEDIVPNELKLKYKKTYYAHFNRNGFKELKNDYNNAKDKNLAKLYILLIYGFNRMLRFNSLDEYNLPVGNVDFNKNVYNALHNYFIINKHNEINWSNLDFKEYINSIKWKKDDFVYLDPPYLITFSEYNKYWNIHLEKELLSTLDKLNDKNVNFAISNVVNYKGKINDVFFNWAEKYNKYTITSNYINYHDNSIKNFTEVLVTNYK
ncbi:MAG: Dam family site-specific DNA-(adenine-N6)-methyltransferase [Bacteroidales bacterium]|jgi:DNA adenine methylase|nr:Dam family site-specific DNA-(adenine-N6)-methyltransferase [Bacteroidales bacterium]